MSDKEKEKKEEESKSPPLPKSRDELVEAISVIQGNLDNADMAQLIEKLAKVIKEQKQQTEWKETMKNPTNGEQLPSKEWFVQIKTFTANILQRTQIALDLNTEDYKKGKTFAPKPEFTPDELKTFAKDVLSQCIEDLKTKADEWYPTKEADDAKKAEEEKKEYDEKYAAMNEEEKAAADKKVAEKKEADEKEKKRAKDAGEKEPIKVDEAYSKILKEKMLEVLTKLRNDKGQKAYYWVESLKHFTLEQKVELGMDPPAHMPKENWEGLGKLLADCVEELKKDNKLEDMEKILVLLRKEHNESWLKALVNFENAKILEHATIPPGGLVQKQWQTWGDILARNLKESRPDASEEDKTNWDELASSMKDNSKDKWLECLAKLGPADRILFSTEPSMDLDEKQWASWVKLYITNMKDLQKLELTDEINKFVELLDKEEVPEEDRLQRLQGLEIKSFSGEQRMVLGRFPPSKLDHIQQGKREDIAAALILELSPGDPPVCNDAAERSLLSNEARYPRTYVAQMHALSKDETREKQLLVFLERLVTQKDDYVYALMHVKRDELLDKFYETENHLYTEYIKERIEIRIQEAMDAKEGEDGYLKPQEVDRKFEPLKPIKAVVKIPLYLDNPNCTIYGFVGKNGITGKGDRAETDKKGNKVPQCMAKGTSKYGKDVTFSGCFENNLPNGNAVYQNENGTRYEGQWRKGQPHGTITAHIRQSIFNQKYINGDRKESKWVSANEATYPHERDPKYLPKHLRPKEIAKQKKIDDKKAAEDAVKATDDAAKATADAAKKTADAAKATADAAQATADAATADDPVKATAEAATATADAAKATAEAATATADAETATADAVKANDAVKATADATKAAADAAKAAADAAKVAADAAKATADGEGAK